MKSEFASLLDLAVAQGHSHSDIISEINSAVLAKFQEDYPKSPADAAVFVNAVSGDVRIFSSSEDITAKFAATASQIARQVVITKLGASDQPPASSPPVKIKLAAGPRLAAFSSLFGNLFFWGYNLYFALFNFFLFISFFSGDFWLEPLATLTSFGLVRILLSVVLFLTPILAMYLALRRRLYRSPANLLRVFFLFELPLVAACLLPITLITRTTPFLTLISLLVLTLPGIFYLHGTDLTFSLRVRKIVYFVSQFVFSLGAYLVLLFSFFVPPILGSIATMVFGQFGDIFYRSPSYYGGILPSPEPVFGLFFQMGIGLLLFLLVATALLVPYMILMVVWRSLSKTRAALAESLTSDQLFTLDAVFMVLIVTISLASAYQPTGNRLLKPLAQLSLVSTFVEKAALAEDLLPQKDQLTRLLKARIESRYRYLFTKDDTTVRYAYIYSLHFPESLAEVVQQTFTTIAYPFVYQGDTFDRATLSTNYQYLFGETIYPSATSTSPVSAKNVLKTYRKVTLAPESGGLVASVTIEEEYANQTNTQQEVLYEFNLPRGAVMTDLRLGPDLEFVGQIAPKGAAQRTYERQLQIRRDPALLEQTGPRQYRLRVFPVPAKNDFATLKGRQQKVSFTYAVAAAPAGYPLPSITRQTNVYTTAASQQFLVTPEGTKQLSDSLAFLPFPATLSPDLCAKTPLDLATVATRSLLAHTDPADLQPLACGSVPDILSRLTGVKTAVFVDVSSPARNSDYVSQLQVLNDSGFLTRNHLDLYQFNDLLGPKLQLTPDNFAAATQLRYFGTSRGLAPLASFAEAYDLVMILSDYSRFNQTDTLPFSSPTRVYLIHPSPPAYTMQLTSKLLQTGGDTADSLVSALRLFALSHYLAGRVPSAYVVSPNLSVLLPDQALTDLSPVPPTGAASALINAGQYLALLPKLAGDISGNITILDRLHAFAVSARLVTPYSSLLALVNDQQQATLDQLSQDYNRYQDQRLTEQAQPPQPRPVVFNDAPSLSPLRSFGTNLDTMTIGPEVGSIANSAIGAPSFGATLDGGAGTKLVSLGGLGFFAVANIALLVFGLGFYLFKLLKK